jgi:DNA-binding CsgD family transcriptional regulator/tetratricopeptide (TPR) repeat protein
VAIHAAIADALEREMASSPAGESALAGESPLPGESALAGEIAHHAMAAHDVPRALTASLAAVAVAERSYAFAEAEVHLDRILEIWPRVDDAADRVGMDHPELLARAARVAVSAGHQARGVRLALDALDELDPADAETRLPILLDLFDYAWEAADIPTAERAVGDAMAMVDGQRTARSAQAFAAEALLRWHQGHYSKARESAMHAIEVARERGARRELARALNVLGQVYSHLGETNNALVVLAEAGEIFEDVSYPVGRARAIRWRAWACFMHGAFEESLALDRLALDIARREGTDARQGLVLLDGILENLIELGRWSEAAATADEIMARMTTSFEMVYSHASLARMYTLMGRVEEAEREIAQAARIPAVGPHRVWQLEDAILLAYATGRYADGRQLVESVVAASPEPDRDATLWWLLLKAIAGEADRAEAARGRRRTAEAEESVGFGRRFAELLRTSADRAIATDGGGPMVRAELLSADAEESRLEGRSDASRWAASVEARSTLEKPWELAYAQYRYAEAILGSGGGAADAAIPLRDAHASASALGAAPLRIAIEGLASRARIRLEADLGAAGQDGDRPATTTLTARELEVLALVAAGHTNREIGDRLFISEKTASVHVTHAMDKLGALSRYEAAATATRLGLLEPAEVP